MPEVKRDAKGRIMKGSTGNPSGVCKELTDVRQFIIQNKAQTIKTFHEYARLKLPQLTEVLASKETTAMQAVIARTYSKAIAGSLPHAQALWDRVIGTVPKTLVTQDEDGKPQPIAMNLNADKLLQVMVKLNELPDDEPCKLIPNLLESSVESSPQSLPPPSDSES